MEENIHILNVDNNISPLIYTHIKNIKNTYKTILKTQRIIIIIMTATLTISKMYKEYFNKVTEMTQKYGNKTLVLFQVGAFYEVYAIKNMETQQIVDSHILTISKLCNLNVGDKHKGKEQKKHILFMGFRDYSLEKYLDILLCEGWTVPVYNQDAACSNTTRSLFKIFTPGSTIINEEKIITNNIMCIWLEKKNPTMVRPQSSLFCGISVLDNHSGKCYIHEYIIPQYSHVPSSYEELERFYSIYNPNELLFIYKNFEEQEITTISQWCSFVCSVRQINLNEDSYFTKNAKNCEKQVYQKEQLSRFYNTNYDEFCETHLLNEYEYAKQSFCFLLDVVYNLNPDSVKKIHEPMVYNCDTNLILANHSLKQLNMIDDNKHSGNLSSVVSFFIQFCKTNMGKREMKRLLVNPIYDETELQIQYDNIETIMTNLSLLNNIRQELYLMNDIEKLYRKMVSYKFDFRNLQNMYNSFIRIHYILEHIEETEETYDLYNDVFSISEQNIRTNCEIMVKKIKNTFHIDSLNEVNYFKPGVYEDLDNIQNKLNNYEKQLETIRAFFENTIEKNEKLASKSKTKKNNYINYHTTEKNGIYLQTTKARSKILQDQIKKLKMEKINLDNDVILDLTNIIYSTATTSNYKIENTQIKFLTNQITKEKTRLEEKVQECFNLFIDELTNYKNEFHILIDFVISLDVLTTKTIISYEKNYCKPVIENYEKSFVDAKDMRHILIEHLQTEETYVPNDICIGKETNGILLFGTNAVGKSSLIKSLGISVILAQSGMFVPCSSFHYKPYHSIFTRILGNDNIFKGLSTFQVEMVELNSILKHSNENSLILGDELCSGTEMISAISIFVSGLENLYKKQNSFIFATHFHEITKMNQIQEMETVKLKHMKVMYDKERDCLVYERKLMDGPGNSNYGLEVCRSLHMPNDFLDRAYEIRKQIDPESKSILDQTLSPYSANKVKGNCEMCNKKGVDIHHLQPQKDANEKGFIKSIHKNHPANLMNVCKSCHKKFTRQNVKMKRVKTTKGYVLKEMSS